VVQFSRKSFVAGVDVFSTAGVSFLVAGAGLSESDFSFGFGLSSGLGFSLLVGESTFVAFASAGFTSAEGFAAAG
jgi:hypothetical protein